MRVLLILPVLLASCQGDERLSGYVDAGAVYRLREMGGSAVTARVTIGFPTTGAVTGEAPCNRYSGDLAVPYPWFRVERLTATERGCADLSTETAYLAALQAMSLAEILGDVLILSNEAGDELVFQAE